MRNNKNFIVPGPYFPAFYRSICSRIPVFVVQTKGSEECSNGLHRRSIRQIIQIQQNRRRGLARTKSLRTRQSDSSILNKNGEGFRNPIKLIYIYKGQEEKVPQTPPEITNGGGFWGGPTITDEHVHINRYRTSVSDPRWRSPSPAESRS